MAYHEPTISRVPSGQPKKVSQFLEQRHAHWKLGIQGVDLDQVHPSVPCIIAIGGGKGGVGKSIYSANFAAFLAKNGYRVLLADMDIGCSNLHTHFGIQKPGSTYTAIIKDSTLSFSDIVMQTPIANLGLITGGRDDLWIKSYEENPNSFLAPFWSGILSSRDRLAVDFVVLDLGAGVHDLTVDLFSSAHLGIAVTLPEPTSIENAYVFLKAVLFQLTEKASLNADNPTDLIELMSLFRGIGTESKGTYVEVMKNFANASPDLISGIVKLLRSRVLGLVVNQARTQYEMDLGVSMQQICSRYFGFQTSQLGYLSYDDAAWKSLRNRRLLLSDFPHGPFAKNVASITGNILTQLGYKER